MLRFIIHIITLCSVKKHVTTFLSVPLLLHSMGQIIRSLASVCLCVCHRSCGRNFE